ncbi:alpha-N-acetylglucosaminidase TIM-barrel domain-containing protein [Rugosimonospora acidiphila]|uniref:alpha-N-acetylglucosaminidase TIM-barrel domain-containing protein n=1 Tax=Rugosimonospora acidiphila TaxID=556531 RepID=UPI0031EAAB8D
MPTTRTGRFSRAVTAVAALASLLLVGTTTPAQATPRAAAKAPAAPAPAPSTGAFDTRPAADTLHRLIGGKAGQVRLRAESKGSGPDRFLIADEHHQLVITGTSPAVLLTGFGWYLKYVAHADISLDGEQLDLPAKLPLPAAPIEHQSSVANRFALNDTNEGYADPYLSWSDWQHRIDVLALHGINEVLVYEGQEAVYEQTFEQYGYTADEMRDWIPEPGHQSWWLLQNICCVGSPISQQLIDQRATLGRQIVDRLRQLGMTPVLPGYYGTVPPQFTTHDPGAVTVPQGNWDGLPRPDWLDPTNQYFGQVAATFYQVSSKLFGDSTMYKMDLLHEGGTAGSVNVTAASQAVQRALNTAHPDAIWAILGWEQNPLPATLAAVDRSKMLVLDGMSDTSAVTDRDTDWMGTPYAFGTIWNFGGHTNLGASLADWNQKFHAWEAKPDTAQNGIALMPEGIDNNPAALEFFTEMPWESGPVDLNQWFTDYATARYGAKDAHADAAWRILGDTVYSWPENVDSRHPTSLFENQPSLTTTSPALPYDPATFEQVLGDLLKVSPKLRNSTAYRYDLVDVARQVLANRSRTMLPAINVAYQAKNVTLFERLTGQWMTQLKLMDSLLGTDDHFLFGTWQKQAADYAASPAESAALQYDVRSLVTFWAVGTSLQDYARREFNGLVGDYYGGRWQAFFDGLDTALKSGTAVAPIDWAAYAQNWAHETTRYPSKPQGSAYDEATKVAQVPAGTLSVSAKSLAVKPGGTVTLTTTFTNQNLLSATGKVTVGLSAPQGYRVSARTSASTAHVGVAGTFRTTWTVTVPAGTAPVTVPRFTTTARWSSGSASDSATASTRVLVTGAVAAPYQTVSNSGASFGQSGDTIGIAGGGADMSGSVDEYAAVYQPKVLTDGHAVVARVDTADAVTGNSRAGLVEGADLSSRGSGGYANLAVTPNHGCVFGWDSDGDGQFDKSTEVDGFGAGTYVRLSRTGTSLSGACSSDGTNWTVVGSATVPGTGDTADVGMFFSAGNAGGGQQGLATFDGFTVTQYAPRDGSADTVRSLHQPVTASGAEAGHPATAANDGSRSNSPYWGGPLTGDTWWQVDLGAVTDTSKINVRNYVDGTRYYTYQLVGSLDGEHWFTLGGRMGTSPVIDEGDTFTTEATARYIRIIGLSNSANSTFHLTEVTVYGSPN